VLVAGESDEPDLIRKIRDWTDGQIQLDEAALGSVLAELEVSALVERHSGAADKRTGHVRTTFALTAAGHSQAVEILADSLTRNA